jgi:hypothetical protein
MKPRVLFLIAAYAALFLGYSALDPIAMRRIVGNEAFAYLPDYTQGDGRKCIKNFNPDGTVVSGRVFADCNPGYEALCALGGAAGCRPKR